MKDVIEGDTRKCEQRFTIREEKRNNLFSILFYFIVFLIFSNVIWDALSMVKGEKISERNSKEKAYLKKKIVSKWK